MYTLYLQLHSFEKFALHVRLIVRYDTSAQKLTGRHQKNEKVRRKLKTKTELLRRNGLVIVRGRRHVGYFSQMAQAQTHLIPKRIFSDNDKHHPSTCKCFGSHISKTTCPNVMKFSANVTREPFP